MDHLSAAFSAWTTHPWLQDPGNIGGGRQTGGPSPSRPDKRAIFTAASKASAAADFLLAFSAETEAAAETAA
jgi:hypothetical protein